MTNNPFLAGMLFALFVSLSSFNNNHIVVPTPLPWWPWAIVNSPDEFETGGGAGPLAPVVPSAAARMIRTRMCEVTKRSASAEFALPVHDGFRIG